jgi:hypothetical protein
MFPRVRRSSSREDRADFEVVLETFHRKRVILLVYSAK